MFQETASVSAAMHRTRGSQRRSEKTSTTIGIAAYRSRITFSPTPEGIANASTSATRYTAKTNRRMRADSTRHVIARQTTKNASPAANSVFENGNRPPGKSRQSTTSTRPASPTPPTGTQFDRSVSRRATATPVNTTTSSRNASGLAASVSAASAANRQLRRDCSAQIATIAKANPSANGNAADSTIPAQTTANVRLDQRAVGPHSSQSTTANASAATAIVATASSLIPRSAASG